MSPGPRSCRRLKLNLVLSSLRHAMFLDGFTLAAGSFTVGHAVSSIGFGSVWFCNIVVQSGEQCRLMKARNKSSASELPL
jgi:hypothetical protein